MSLSFAIAIYFIVWWTVLFAVLPLGVRTQAEEGSVVPGTPESAPANPRLWWIAGMTTLVTTVLFAGAWAAIHFGLLDLATLIGRVPSRP